jgi:uncharacterized protein (TIGR02594 family)
MRSMGYPKSGAWCGEFASAVIRKAGGTPPAGSAIASNWMKYGTADSMPHVGDIAVRNGVPIGSTGGHVGFVTKVNPDGSFVMEGGNQGGHTFMTRHGGYSFRRAPDNVTAALLGTGGDASLAGLHGNAYIKATRSGFAKELSDPQKRLQFAAMLLSEGNPLQTAESAMNRSSFQHKTLMQALHSGFYGPINRGKLPEFMARLRNNPKLMAQMNSAINSALAGSDTIKGSTDQGMVTDPNGGYILHHFHVWGKGHGNIYGDWNGGRGTERWRHNFEAHAAQGDDTNDATAGSGSPAIQSTSPSGGQVIHINLKADGRTLTHIVHKHTARQANMPPRSARLSDPFAHTPSFPV